MSDEGYLNKVRTAAIGCLRDSILGWSDEEHAAGANQLINRGFGRPETGFTGRTTANALRKVRADLPFPEAQTATLLLNAANRAITGADNFDKKPWRCTHCGDRFANQVSPRTHDSNHSTVFDPRTY